MEVLRREYRSHWRTKLGYGIDGACDADAAASTGMQHEKGIEIGKVLKTSLPETENESARIGSDKLSVLDIKEIIRHKSALLANLGRQVSSHLKISNTSCCSIPYTSSVGYLNSSYGLCKSPPGVRSVQPLLFYSVSWTTRD